MATEEENFKKISSFFEYNAKVKQELTRCASLGYSNEEDFLLDFSFRMHNSLENIKYYFERMFALYPSLDIEMSYVFKYIDSAILKLDNMKLNYNDLISFYNNVIAKIRPELNSKLNEECKGYYIFSSTSLTDGDSINEFLHIFHHRIVNNENIYQSMPKISSKNTKDHEIVLYGNDNEVSRRIYDGIACDKKLNGIDILSLSEDKILIMARGAGHALTIEIEREKIGDYMVRYFIPKITNSYLVNLLPGVRKVNNESRFTTGEFLVTKENLDQKIPTFINMVPRDLDNISYESDVERLENRIQDIENEVMNGNLNEEYVNYLREKYIFIKKRINELTEVPEPSSISM